MKHIRVVSSQLPRRAQFESILQLIGVFSAIVGLYEQVSGIIADKAEDDN